MNLVKFFPRVLRIQRYHYRNITSDNLDEDSLDLKHQKALEVYEKSLSMSHGLSFCFILTIPLRILEISNVRARTLLRTHPVLIVDNAGLRDVQATVEFLKKHDVSNEEILKRPRALLVNQITMANRIKVLEECCFKEKQLMFLYRYVSVMNKSVNMMKAFDYIDQSSNVAESLLTYLDVHIVPKAKISDQMSLNEIRYIITNEYLQKRLAMTHQDLAKYWKVYPRLKHRSFQYIVEVIKILETLSFEHDRIIKNGFLLYACPVNFNRIITEIPTIGDEPIRNLIYKRPKVAMQPVDTLKEILAHLKTFEINENYLLKCLDLLTLSSDSVYDRLVELTKVSEFNVLKSNPRVLRLIH
jgi:hypothetical protein